MTEAQRARRVSFAAISFLLCAAAAGAQAEWSGSFTARSGPLILREGIPDDASQDWFSRIGGTARVKGGRGAGRFSSEGSFTFDPSTGIWIVSLDEAWGQWSPLGWISFRLGRSRLSFGPCLAFNPANSFQSRDPFDLRAGKTGLDGLQAEFRPLEAFWPNPPLGLSLQTDFLLPQEPAATNQTALPVLHDLDGSSARARLVFLFPEVWILAQTELGFSGDLRGFGTKERRWATGCWLSADIFGFVLGAEGGLRSHGYAAGLTPAGGDEEIEAAFGLSRRFGDLFCVVEARWYDVTEAWQGFLRLSFSCGDFGASGTVLADFTAEAARTGLDLTWNASDELVVGAALTWNYEPELWADPGPLPVDASAVLGAEWFY